MALYQVEIGTDDGYNQDWGRWLVKMSAGEAAAIRKELARLGAEGVIEGYSIKAAKSPV